LAIGNKQTRLGLLFATVGLLMVSVGLIRAFGWWEGL